MSKLLVGAFVELRDNIPRKLQPPLNYIRRLLRFLLLLLQYQLLLLLLLNFGCLPLLVLRGRFVLLLLLMLRILRQTLLFLQLILYCFIGRLFMHTGRRGLICHLLASLRCGLFMFIMCLLLLIAFSRSLVAWHRWSLRALFHLMLRGATLTSLGAA